MPIKRFNNKEDLIAYCISNLEKAVPDPGHQWHWPVFITSGSGRVVVMREFLPTNSIRFYTDKRSEKVREIRDNSGECSFLFYSGSDRTQLRCKGFASELVDHDLKNKLWNSATIESRKSYATTKAPGEKLEKAGTGLPVDWESGNPSEDSLEKAFENFVVYDVKIIAYDFLLLSKEGQQRAKFTLENKKSFSWVTP